MRRIEMKQQPGGPAYFQEAGKDGRMFRRVVGGLAWPTRGRAGFLVALGEDFAQDGLRGVRHLRVLGELQEHEGEGFLSPAALLRGAIHLRDLLAVQRFGAPDSPHCRELREVQRGLMATRRPRLQIDLPPGYSSDRIIEHYAALVRKRLATEKTLHFGASVLPAVLGGLPRDLSGLGFDDSPEITALYCAVAILDLAGRDDARPKARPDGPADGVVGY